MGTKEWIDILRPERTSFWSVLGPVGVVATTDVLRQREGQHAAEKQKKQCELQVHVFALSSASVLIH